MVFGNNMYEQLGLGDTKDRLNPAQIPNIKGKKIPAELNHTIMVGVKII